MIIECKTISSWNSIQRNYNTESYTTEFDGRLLLKVNEEDVFKIKGRYSDVKLLKEKYS